MSEESHRFCELGAEHLEREEPEEALHYFERAIAEDPESAEAWSGRGEACYHLARFERADRCFRRSLRLLEPSLARRPRRRGWWADPTGRTYLRLLYWRALCRFWMAAYEDAARTFRKILKLAPSDPLEVRFRLGETYYRMGSLERAIAVFQRCGDDTDAAYNLGLAWFYLGDFTKSVGAFRRAIFENPYVVGQLTGAHIPTDIPSCRATHPRQLDTIDVAMDYADRCTDFWHGRPLLQAWLRAIYEHPTVQADFEIHVDQVRRLATSSLTSGAQAPGAETGVPTPGALSPGALSPGALSPGALSPGALSPGDVAQLEGQNARLRSEERLAETDPAVTRDVMDQVFPRPA